MKVTAEGIEELEQVEFLKMWDVIIFKVMFFQNHY